MNRRNTVAALLALAAVPRLSIAQQQAKVWRIGLLSGRPRPAHFDTDIYGAFEGEMRKLGYLEGKTARYEWRFADNKYERLPSLAAELVQLKVDLIVAFTTQPILAAKQATASIPIVMVAVADPVGSGIVTSLARPGGNITGITNFVGDTTKKQLDLLVAAIPKASRVAVLLNPDNSTTAAIYGTVEAAAGKMGMRLLPAKARTATEIEQAFLAMKKERADAVLIVGDTMFFGNRDQIAQIALKAKLPTFFAQREHVEAGGLMSYGANLRATFQRAAVLVDRILKGAKPADIPVEQPTAVELVINMKTAKTLGVTVSQELLFRADKIIE